MITPESWCSPPESDGGDAECDPQLIGCIISNLAAMGWRPLLLTGLFRDLLVHHFATTAHIEEPDLRRFVWQEDERSGILIASEHRWRGELVEKRPAVIIKRNAYKNLRIGIADRIGINERGGDAFLTTWVGSHTLFCIHGTGAGTEILATEVQRELTQFTPVLVSYLKLLKFKVNEIGPISELEEATENFVVPITVGWAYEEKWSIDPASLPLKAVRLVHAFVA